MQIVSALVTVAVHVVLPNQLLQATSLSEHHRLAASCTVVLNVRL